ncbi:DUF427 domain-containing protein [Brevundimonas sp. TSRC1-1]|uniref:DUF427 domain-containing protein n=1 Tax=Brevundimonas sp. TSRC1-1 TaxID=2804562 RepID=UPI003CF49FCF
MKSSRFRRRARTFASHPTCPSLIFLERIEGIAGPGLTRTYLYSRDEAERTALGAPGLNSVWTYETPLDAVADIAGRLAFYSDRVSISLQD